MVLNLFLNFEQKWASCSYKIVFNRLGLGLLGLVFTFMDCMSVFLWVGNKYSSILLNYFCSACVHCEIEWGPWEPCLDDKRTRFQFVVKRPVGPGGRECAPLEREEEDCVNCEVEWLPWGECENGRRVRYQGISRSPVGAGEQCPILNTEIEGEQNKSCLYSLKNLSVTEF